MVNLEEEDTVIAALQLSKRTPDISCKTRLDSHAISPVVGYNAYVVRDTGKTTNIAGFTNDLGSLKAVPIVDAVVMYECPFSMKKVLLMIHNAVYMPNNPDNLIPPFLIREAGIPIDDVAKIQCGDPSVENHSMYLSSVDVRVHFSLTGIVSYFSTSKPSREDLEDEAIDLINITPDMPSWDPYTDVYERQEERMLDFEGNMVEPLLRNRVIVDVESGESMDFENISEDQHISAIYKGNEYFEPLLVEDEADLDEFLVGDELSNALKKRLEAVKLAESLGAEKSEPDYVIGAMHHQDKPKGITPERLSKVFKIDIPTAKRTIEATTQRIKRQTDPSLGRNFSTNDRPLRYRRIKDHFFMDTFFATGKVGKTRRGNKCMQLFVTDKGFVFVVAMKDRSQVHKAVKLFLKHIGIPDALICDGAKEQVSGKTKEICDTFGTTLRRLEHATPWANRAELYIGLLKRAIKKDLLESDCPLKLWDYCAERCAKVNNVTAKDLFQLQGQTAEYHVTGTESDISNICQFGWYEWVYFRDKSPEFPLPHERLGRALGPAINAGNEMAQWVLTLNGEIIPRQTCRPLKTEEIHSPTEQRKRDAFDESIRHLMGDSLRNVVQPDDKNDDTYVFGDTYEPYEDEEEVARSIPESDNGAYDEKLFMELVLPNQDKMMNAKVIARTKDSSGHVKGEKHENPILDTRVYDVQFEDGTIKEYAANVLAENLFSQVDELGYQYQNLESIMDHRKDHTAITMDNMFVVDRNGKRSIKKTTMGWELKVHWKDGSTSWVALKELKESNPIEVAEYAKRHKIDTEPAFRWWVPYTLRKRDTIIAAVNQRVKKANFKYGIKVPKDVTEAIQLDKLNKNDFWQKAIQKEMSNVSVAFKILENDEKTPGGYSLSSCKIIFDVKMDGTRKARFVKAGHLTEDPDGSRYAGVVSRESVRIALTYAALNGVDVFAADIRNAYLQAAPSEKHYIICGPEFGIENVGKRAIIVRALYGGKTSGRDFRNALRACMTHLDFTSCLADPDVWMRKAKKADGTPYWEYVLLYVDDALVISDNGEAVLRNEIGKYFTLKEESIGAPSQYLGGHVSKVTLENGVDAWAFSSSKYVQESVANVEKELAKTGGKLPASAKAPLSANYRPELDMSPELEAADASYYQSLIGVLRWIVELGRVDITCEVSMMSSHLAMPREGHMEEVLRIFAYLKKNHNAEMVFDPSDPLVETSDFPRRDWEATEFGELEEELPANMPEARGLGMVMRAYVDADHAGDSITRRSRTGFIVYLQCAPIYWLSKKQTSVETSSFGSEFVAMKQCTEYVRGLRYKLRMMGIACEMPTLIYGDNKSVLANTTIPDSQLKKKSNSIAYHFVREGCARDEWRTTYINTHENPADLLTKPLPSGEKRVGFIRMILYHLFGGGH